MKKTVSKTNKIKKSIRQLKREADGLALTSGPNARGNNIVQVERNFDFVGPNPTKCQLCGTKFQDSFVDGKTHNGPWAFMCDTCHQMQGYGLGKGKGQRFFLPKTKRLKKMIGIVALTSRFCQYCNTPRDENFVLDLCGECHREHNMSANAESFQLDLEALIHKQASVLDRDMVVRRLIVEAWKVMMSTELAPDAEGREPIWTGKVDETIARMLIELDAKL